MKDSSLVETGGEVDAGNLAGETPPRITDFSISVDFAEGTSWTSHQVIEFRDEAPYVLCTCTNEEDALRITTALQRAAQVLGVNSSSTAPTQEKNPLPQTQGSEE